MNEKFLSNNYIILSFHCFLIDTKLQTQNELVIARLSGKINDVVF